MFKKPWLNAVAASGYIFLLVWVMTAVEVATKLQHNQYFAPVVFLSMFTLSAAVMGGLFLLKPVQLYLNGKKKYAVTFFLQTILYFAGLTIVTLLLVLSGLFSKR